MPRKPRKSSKTDVGDNVEEEKGKSEEDEEDADALLRVDMKTDNIFRDHDDNTEYAIPVEMEDLVFKSENFTKEKIKILMADDYKVFINIPKQVNLKTGIILQQKHSVGNLAQRTYALEAHNRRLEIKLEAKNHSLENLHENNRVLEEKNRELEKQATNHRLEKLLEKQRREEERNQLNVEIERLNAEVQKPAKRACGGRVSERPEAEKSEIVDLTGEKSD